VEGPIGTTRTTLKDNLEIFILGIDILDTLKCKYLGPKSREQKVPPRKCIGNFVHLAGLVLDYKMEGLHELHPLSMSWIEFMLTLDELQSLVICMEDELSSQQMMSPMFQCPHNGVELLVICRIFPFCIILLFAKASNGPLFL